MVLQSNLNNMNLTLEDMSLRTHENMQNVLGEGKGNDFSVHPVENIFWKFL